MNKNKKENLKNNIMNVLKTLDKPIHINLLLARISVYQLTILTVPL
jgi:hypothetical protein